MKRDTASKFLLSTTGLIGAAFGTYEPNEEGEEHPFWIYKLIQDDLAQFFERVDPKEKDRSKIRWYFGVAGKGKNKPESARATLPLKRVSQMGPLVLDLDDEVDK